ncbi:MAG: NUMOD4 motif-containing HNH endonuclease [Selenomonadaceae bacterium]|nr:NUMOD4 motif-containing HNH endonuclease [Selenomonadaceae bacterium]
MNQEQACEILRANVKNLSEPLKSAVEFTLETFYQPLSASELAKNFLVSLPSMTTKDAELKAKIDAAYFTLQNDLEVWLSLKPLPHEVWRPISGYEKFYEISNYGRIKSFKRSKPAILKGTKNNHGYFMIVLNNNTKPKVISIHKIVAQAFIPNLENKPCVNHIDGNKLNNHIGNLEWATLSENTCHAYAMGLIKSGCEHPRAKFTPEQIKYIRESYIPRNRKFSFGALARKFGVNVETIERIYHFEAYKNVT